ncbi:tyrosine-type recombinase/integrase [Aeromicrobium sp. PE09-221]|uniref:tyrosine-type recombinase/integrase n=1 Tax=Aeromicrobium sp. PE09-221 TaxID=1898043 RepID=UPI000B3ED57D|nr:tyrosine-type recombinase/integrase [Aeromicrobium sp. PE09-221]
MTAAGAPETTRNLRTYHLQRLAADMTRGPWTVTFDYLVQWLAGQGWAANTRKSYRQSLRSFCSWAMATGRVTESPAHLLPPVRVPRGNPRPVDEATYRAALASADERVRLALLLGGAMGLRRSEIARARREDLVRDLVGWSLRVTGKGGHVRVVPALAELAEVIRAGPAGWLFPSAHGGHLTGHHLAKLMSAELGDYSAHALRHRCGSVAYGVTRDLRAVQELLGHARPETTAAYTLVPDDDVRAAMMAAPA